MAKGAVKDWTKNAAQSVKYTAVELGSETAPFLTNTISNAASAIKDMTDWIKRNSPEKTSNANKESFVKRAVNKGKETFKIAMDDLKAGNLNFDGINSKFSNSMNDMYGDYADEPNFDFDFDDDNGDLFGDSSDSDSSSSFEGLTGEMYASGLEISTKANIEAISESTSIISQSALNAAAASTKQLVATNFANTARLSSQLADVILNTKATNDNVASLVEFNNNTITPFISQAQQYMENTEQTLNDIKAILETRLVNPEVDSSGHRRRDLIRGGIDVQGFLKKVTDSSVVQFGMAPFVPVISMLSSMGVPMPKFIADNPMISMMGGSFNPMKLAAKYMLPSLFGKKSKLKDFDNIFEYFALNIADKISKSDLFGEFGQRMFDSAYVDKSGYNKGAVVWSGKDSKVLQEVIPSYLSHIETNTEQTVKSLNTVVDILHRTLMGQHGMVQMYDELTGLELRKKRTGTYKSGEHAGQQYEVAMSSTAYANLARNKALGKEFKLYDLTSFNNKFGAGTIDKRKREKLYDENGNAILNDKGKQKYKMVTHKYTRFNMKKGKPSRSDAYSDSRIWNAEAGDYTTKRAIRKDFQYDLDSTYKPFTEFFELCEELFDLNNDPTARDAIGSLVSAWANKLSEVDAAQIVDEIISMESYNTKSGESINDREKMKLRATLVNAKRKFISDRKELIESINSGENVYGALSSKEIDDYRKEIKFVGKDDFVRQMVYATGDKKKIDEWEKQQKLKESFEKQGDLPFDKVLTDKEFIKENGKYKDQEYAIDKGVWQFKDKTNKLKRFINEIAIKMQGNGIDRGVGNMSDTIFNKFMSTIIKMQNFLNGDVDDSDIPKTFAKFAKEFSDDVAKTAGQQAATGAHRIPEEGWWLLHPNERVLTAEEANEYDELMHMLRNGEISPVGSSFVDPKTYDAIRKKINKWNKKMANRGFEKMSFSDAMAMYNYSESDASSNKKSSRFIIKRRKPANEDEKEKLRDYTNNEVEKAETKEDVAFEMQQEMADNVRSIAAMTAAESDRNAEKAKKDNLDDSSKTVKGLFSKLSSVLFGDKDDNGFFSNGPFASIANSLIDAKRKFAYTFLGKGYVDKEGNIVEGKDVGEDITSKLRNTITELKDSANESLFGKKSSAENENPTPSETSNTTKKTKGVRHRVYEYDANGKAILTDKGKHKYHMEDGPANPIEAATADVASSITEAGNATVEIAFGDDDIDSLEEKAKQLAVKDKKTAFAEYAKKLGKGALIGGLGTFALKSSLGTIPSLLFPGGPVAGAILGIGGAMLSQTETFKKIVFGELDEDGERTGGLISKSMNERFKKVLPFIVGGAGIGALQKFFLPAVSLLPGPGGALMNMFFGNGPIAGALLGLGGGLLASSEKFKQAIFGDEDEDGELYGGILSKPAEAVRKFYKKNSKSLKGAGIGALAGLLNNRLIASTAGTGGLLYKVFGVGGPIGAALVGSAIGIATGSERFQEMLFGKDTGEVDENGKPIRDKSGLIGRFMNVFEINVIRPLAEWSEYARDSFVNWLKHDLGDHVKSIFRPLQEALQDAGENVADVFGNFGGMVAKILGMAMHPITKLLPAALKLGVKTTTGVLTGAGKMIGGTISAPLKALDFMLNVAPGGIGKRRFKEDNKAFQREKYGEGLKGGLLNFKDFMFNRKEWNAARQEYGDAHGINKDSGFFYFNKQEAAKLDKKDVTDEYKKRKGITNMMQKWATKDGYNGSIILDDDELEKRKKWLAKRGVDTEGWTSQDMVDFMYSNDEKRKAKATADEDAKLQREANQAEIDTREEIKSFKEKFQSFMDRFFKRDTTVTNSESDEVARINDTDDSFEADDMPSEESKNVFTALTAIEHNKSVKSDKEKAKAAEDVKKAQSQALAGKDITEEDGNKITAIAAGVTEDESEKSSKLGGIFSKITEYVGKGLAVGAIALLATKINWGGVWEFVKKTAAGIVNNFKDRTEERRTYIDEETGEEVVAPSALDAQVLGPRLANTAFRFVTGTNLPALLHDVTGGKMGGIKGKLSSKLGHSTLNAASKGLNAVKTAATNGKFYADAAYKYGDDILKGSKLNGVEKFFMKIYKVLGKMKDSPTLQKIAGTKLGKAIDAIINAFKNISTKFGKVLGKNTGKLTNATAKAAVKSAKDFVPILNVVIWSAGAITGALDVANLFYLNDADDADVWMRVVSAIIGFLRSTMVGSLVDIIAEILKDATGFDLWHFIAVPCYKIFASDEQDAALDESMAEVEKACDQYNKEHGTNLSVSEYNDQIKNRTIGTKILGVFGLDKKKKSNTTKTRTSSETPTYAAYYNTSDSETNDSESEGYGSGMTPVGYGIDHYTQNDPRWGRRRYARRRSGMSTSMATGGCGPTALANAATQLGVNVNPMQIAGMAQSNGYTADGGTNARMFTDGVRKLGLRSSNIGRGGVKSALRSGRKVILSGKGSDGIYTKAGHIISARGLDSRGNAIVDDPMSRRVKHIPINKLTANSTHAWSIGYGPDLTVDEAFSTFGSPNKHVVSDGSTDKSTALYYSYQQRYYDANNKDRNWGDMAIYNGESTLKNGYATIGDVGCLMTSISSLLSNISKRDFDPLTFAKMYGSKAFATTGDIQPNSEGNRDAIIDLLNADFGDGNGPFVEYLTRSEGTLKADKKMYEFYHVAKGGDCNDILNGALYPRPKSKKAASMLCPPRSPSGITEDTDTGAGLFSGYPVVMHGSGPLYSDSGSEHAVIFRGVFKKYIDGKPYIFTTKFDPGRLANNGTEVPLTDIINDKTLKKTKRIITFSGSRDDTDWSNIAAQIDADLGTEHDDLVEGAYNDTYDVKSASDSDKPSGILDAISRVLTGLGKIAGNIFSALGTKDFKYTSIFSNRTSSLFGDSAGGTGYDYSGSTDYRTKGPSETYRSLKNEYGITEEYLNNLKKDKVVSTGIGLTYTNIPKVKSNKLPADVLTQMRMNLIPMIASHESGGSFDNVYTDSNGKIAFGIGGFNGSNAAEVLRRMSNAISAEVSDVGIDGNMTDKRGYFNSGTLNPSNWSERASKLMAYADKADGANNFSTSDYHDITAILKDAPGLAKAAEVAVLNDLISIYLNSPLKHYDDGSLLDPRSVMQLAEFGGYGPDHLNRKQLWQMIKSATTTPESNVNDVRDAMIKYYALNTSAFVDGHKTRIAETASSLLSIAEGFAPVSIMPGGQYGISDTKYQNALKEYLNKASSLAATKNLNAEQMQALETAVRIQLRDQIDNGADVDLSNLGLGPGNNYSSADIYTEPDDIQRYNANNPLPVKMNTRPIESRIDTIIHILQQMVKAYNAQNSSEGYGKAIDPIGNSQRVSNAGITTQSRMPLYEKDINENHTDPLRRVFQSIAASPR